MGVLLINSNISLDKIVYFDIIHPSKDNNVIQITYLINKTTQEEKLCLA